MKEGGLTTYSYISVGGCSQKLLFPGGLCAFMECLSYLHGTKGFYLLKKMAICSASYNIAGYLLALLEKNNPF